MIYWQNRILTNVAKKLGDKCKNVVSTENNTRPIFPTCEIKVVENRSIADDLECEDGENAVLCGVQAVMITKKSLSETIDLMRTVHEAMYKMGFKLKTGPLETTYATNPDECRVTSRFTRVIGACDVIELFD